MGDRKALNVPSAGKLTSKSGLKVSSKIRQGSQVRSQIRSKTHMTGSQARIRTGSKYRFDDGDMEGDQWMETKEPVKPEDQLELTEEEMKQEFTRILHANNPHAPDNIVRFSQKDREYKQMSTVVHMAMLFSMDGTMIHKESDEARRQNARQGVRRKTAVATTETSTEPDEGVEEGEPAEAEAEEAAEGETEGKGKAEGQPEVAVQEEEEEDVGGAGGEVTKPLRNQFNYSERASQTFNHSSRERGTQMAPPPRVDVSANVTQWDIYDLYVTHLEQQAAKQDKKPKKDAEVNSQKIDFTEFERAPKDDSSSQWAAASRIVRLSVAKKMERMVNQNNFDDVAQDYKYWEDASDAFKEGEGSLLPLWKFTSEATRKRTVTSLAWSQKYTDLLAVSVGSYDYLKQGSGAISIYTLKNPTTPEYQIRIDSGVMCLDFHKQHPSLLAAGLYDGSVVVYDLSHKDLSKPLFRSTAKTGKHADPVWEVAWQSDDVDLKHNFCSVSGDGRITNWTLVMSELQWQDVIQLREQEEASTENGATGGAGAAAVLPNTTINSGTCLSFNPKNEHLLLVGTEEGKVHLCSRAYTSKFIKSFAAHEMAVYAVQWNPFHPRVFATCSADWTLKIWDSDCATPMFTYDLGNPVGDLSWSPYSAVVISAVTTDGRTHVFDMGLNKHAPLCVQNIVMKAKLTHIRFNPVSPTLAVGDDRGNVTTLKLSPNLRKALKGKKLLTEEAQIAAMDKLLSSVREVDEAAPAVVTE